MSVKTNGPHTVQEAKSLDSAQTMARRSQAEDHRTAARPAPQRKLRLPAYVRHA